MTRLRGRHWALGFLLALALHLASYAWLTIGPVGTLIPVPEPARGGGTFGGTGDRGDIVSGLLVSLGPAQPQPAQPAPAPAPAAAEAPAQEAAVPEPPAAELPAESAPEAPPSAPAEAEAATPEPAPERAPEPAPVETEPEAPAEAKVAAKAPPTPRRKPKAPPPPQVDLLEERLPVQGPASAQDTAPSQPSAPQPAPSPAGQDATQVFELVQSPSEGRLGTAGLNSDGRVPELNYKERVILWLKRYGGYPRDAYRFRQEGVVLLHFIIDRRGRILVYNIRQSSGYHLLDLAVKQMMERASPVPPIPQEIQLAKMEFTVPVRFIRD